MRTASYKVDVASDRRRRENVQGTFFVLNFILPVLLHNPVHPQYCDGNFLFQLIQ